MTITVSGLFIYPLKSAAGISVSEFSLDSLGPINDRHWMLIDDNDRFVSQREYGALALVHPSLAGDNLRLESAGHSALEVERPRADALIRQATIWGDVVPVLDAGDEAAAWSSRVMNMSCRLVNLAPYARRPLAPKYAGPLSPDERFVSLNDGAPMLLLGDGSLTELNNRLTAKGVANVGIDRFRPNIMLSGTADQEEDTWLNITIGDVEIGVGSRCGRCVMTTVEQSTGKRAPAREGEAGGEPLRTIASYRREAGSVMFGMNITHAALGTIRVGDVVTVKEKRGS